MKTMHVKTMHDNDIVLIDRVLMVERIASDVVQEIRTPLMTVGRFLNFLAEKEEISPYRPQIQSMLQQIDRTIDLLGEFIAVAQPKDFQPDRDNLNNIVAAIKELLNAVAVVHRHRIGYDLAPTADILADRKRICQVILNLVKNAFEAMPAPPKDVTLKASMEDGKVCFLIIDQGPGFDPAILANLGKSYQTTKSEGTGLGLFACQDILEKHNTKLDISSSPQGATIKILFDPLPEPSFS